MGDYWLVDAELWTRDGLFAGLAAELWTRDGLLTGLAAELWTRDGLFAGLAAELWTRHLGLACCFLIESWTR